MARTLPRHARARRGFALLITVVLLAFLVLLLVVLSSMTRVETQVSSNQQQLAQARQNALLGLQIALGQLQKYAGPDQRVTATADLNSTGNATVANPHYTGVWDVAAVNASAKTNIPLAPTASADTDPDNPTKFSPTPLPDPTKPAVWLVSGNENPAAPTAVGYNTVTSGNSSCVTLVGNATTTVNSATDTVQVPTVPITSASVPGVSGNVTTGKFAYWVGDEGVKAKFNVADPYTPRPAADASTPAFTPTTMQGYYRQATAQRYGIEQMSTDGTSTTTGTTPIGADYAPTANTTTAAALIRDLGKVVSYPDTQLLSYPDPVATFNPSTVFKNRYWDLTTSSYGILTDTANGGLKYDLTWDFSQKASTSNKLLLTGAIVQAVTWIPTSTPPAVAGQPTVWWPSSSNLSTVSASLDPQWNVLRDFYQLGTSLSSASYNSAADSVTLTPMLPNGAGSISTIGNGARTNNPIFPVFVQARIYFGAEATANPDGSPAGVNGKDYVLFIVANPYDTTLSVPNGLSFVFYIGSGGGQDIPMTVVKDGTAYYASATVTAKTPNPDGTTTTTTNTYYSKASIPPASSYPPNTTTSTTYNPVNLLSQFPGPGGGHWFTCPGPLSFAPGEVKVLTLAPNPPAGGASTAAQLQVMTESTGDPTTNAIVFPLPVTNTSTTTGWKIILNPASGQNGGDCEFDMYSNAGNPPSTGTGSQHLARLKYISYQLPATGMGSNGTFTNTDSTINPFDIGGFVFSLKMPAETGYSASSAVRFLADYNARSMNLGSYQGDGLTLYYSYFNNDKDSFNGNTIPATWGLQSSATGFDTQNAILYHIPRVPAGAPAWEPVILSIADLQNADVTTTAQEPTYAIGNSYASVFCQPERSVSVPQPCGNPYYSRTNPSWRYDMSYLCNEALWDTYYFSTVPQTSVSASATYNPQTDTLPDSRYVPIEGSGGLPTQAALTASSTSAAALLRVNGAFNVNSTSVEAWKAVFSSLRGTDNNTASDGSTPSSPFFRSLWQTGGSASSQLGNVNNSSWTGVRSLSSAEVNALATQMVAQVRLRGPFRSLGDFINRRLLAEADDPNDLRLRGALQAAIDAAGINSLFNSNPSDQAGGNDVTNAYVTTPTPIPALQYMNPDNAVGNRATGAPGWLMQADVLQAIGATLSDRSDTFVIRSYGEAVNPATGATESKAYCEAVVQRVPDYVDPTNAPTIAPAPASALPANPLTTLNQTFGRRFKIVSFRWLTPDDI